VLRAAIAASPTEYVFPVTRGPRKGQRQRHDAKMSRVLRTAMAKAGIVVAYRYSCRRKGCGFKVTQANQVEGFRCPRCNFKLWEHRISPAIRWYDLRHSATTLHTTAKCDPLVVSYALGHADKSTTDKYRHLENDPEYVRRELSKLKL
jgi:hypothetical protein